MRSGGAAAEGRSSCGLAECAMLAQAGGAGRWAGGTRSMMRPPTDAAQDFLVAHGKLGGGQQDRLPLHRQRLPHQVGVDLQELLHRDACVCGCAVQ